MVSSRPEALLSFCWINCGRKCLDLLAKEKPGRDYFNSSSLGASSPHTRQEIDFVCLTLGV